ncbi:MAG TPA: hypothetical protein VFP50_12085 [Anaeromyxobacteraceae bacterium]|nr:hypothetical protein [Anaeromyxobacteraceae bacterium]
MAAAHQRGPSVGAFAQKLLGGPLPWSKMRQAQALVRLCDRYGAERVEAACQRAIGFEVHDVPRIERLLKLARACESDGEAAGKVVQLPGRFARAPELFATRRPNDGGAP